MKRFVIPAILTLGLLAGCTKWLDVEPIDRILEGDAFKTEAGANSVLNGLYATMTGDDLYGYLMGAGTLDMLAHYYDFPATDDAASSINSMHILGVYDYTDLAVNAAYFDPIWKRGYGLILRTNVYIDNMVGHASMVPSRRDLYLGEAYGLRALLHLDMLRVFHSHDITAEGGKSLPYHTRNKVEAIAYEASGESYLDKVEADIERAEELLLANDPILSGNRVYDSAEDQKLLSNNEDRFATMFRNKRMNYWAVQVLKLRVHMLRKEYDQAIDLAQFILSESVDQTFTALENDQQLKPRKKPFAWTPLSMSEEDWSRNSILYDEVIMCLSQNNLQKLYNNYFGTGSKSEPKARVMVAPNLLRNVLGLDGERSTPPSSETDLNNSKSNDRRNIQYRALGMLPGGIGPASDKFFATTKFNPSVSAIGEKYDNIGYRYFAIKDAKTIMRMSEVLLSLAEALLKRDRVAEAVTVINSQLIRRGYKEGPYETSNTLPAGATKAHAEKMLEKEWYREFVSEGQAFFYLKRNARTTVIRGNDEGTTAMALENYKLPRPENETEFYGQ